jgi:MFS family permease
MGCAVLTAVIFIPAHTPGTPLLVLTFLLSVFIGLNQGVLVGYIPELFPTLIRGVATGICFNTGRLVTTGAVLIAGALITWMGGYNSAILAFGVAYVIGFFVVARARETRGMTLPS